MGPNKRAKTHKRKIKIKKSRSKTNYKRNKKFYKKKNLKRIEPSGNEDDMKSINKLGCIFPSKEKYIERKYNKESTNIDYDNIIKIDPLSPIMKQIKKKENIIIKDTNFIENTGGGDCYYKSLSQCLYGTEIYHYALRQKIYKSLHNKSEQYNNSGITINIGNINIPIKEYIEKIQNKNFWAGDLELSETNELYKMNIIVYKVLKRDDLSAELSFYNIYGNIYNNNPNILLTLINNNHYNIIKFSNEQNVSPDNNALISIPKKDKDNNDNSDIKKINTLNKDMCNDYYYNLSQYNKSGQLKKTKKDYPYYPNVENGDTFYSDIINFLISTINYLKGETKEKIWPSHINSVIDYKEKENKKRYFRKKVNKYFYYNNNLYIIRNKKAFETNHKILSLLALNKVKEIEDLINNNPTIFLVPKLFECRKKLNDFHISTHHRGYDTLIKKFNDEKIYWKGISQDINFYILNCSICQCKNHSHFKNPFIKQILFNKPKDRYIIDLTNCPDNIKDNTNYKFMLHIVDHYSKFVFGKLLEDKKADTVLNNIKNILFVTGMPKEIGTDNGAEFKNKKFVSFCEENKIKLIHGLPGKPHAQGACERIHQTIIRDLSTLILDNKNYNYENLENDYQKIIYDYNNIEHHSTKYKPIFLFYNNTEDISIKVEQNCKSKFKHVNKNYNSLKVGDKVLLNPKFIKNGNMITFNKVKKGKIFFRIPGLIQNVLDGGYYNIKISVNYLQGKLKKGEIYKVYYKLLKKCTDSVWKELCDNFEKYVACNLPNKFISDSSNSSNNEICDDSESDF